MIACLRRHAPRFHGNGFVQLPLGHNRRLHVWHPSLPPIPDHNATIHNHVWDMQSRILLGTLTHRTWEVVREYYARCTHDLYSAGEGGPDRHDGICRLELSGEYQMSAGSLYVFPALRWHESESHCLSATLMEKRHSAHSSCGRPLVACPRGELPVDAFAPEHQPSEQQMWEAVWQAVTAMPEWARQEIISCLDD